MFIAKSAQLKQNNERIEDEFSPKDTNVQKDLTPPQSYKPKFGETVKISAQPSEEEILAEKELEDQDSTATNGATTTSDDDDDIDLSDLLKQ